MSADTRDVVEHSGYWEGPWEAVEVDGEWSIYRAGTQHFITAVTGTVATEANARLMADAPRLYEENVRLRAQLAEAVEALEGIQAIAETATVPSGTTLMVARKADRTLSRICEAKP